MPDNPQNKRNIWLHLNGFSIDAEAYSGGKVKRLESAKPVVFAGQRKATYLHDPVQTVEAITGRIVCRKDAPFLPDLYSLFEAHMDNPDVADSALMISHNDDLSVNGTARYTKAVLQEITPPDGDRQSSDMVNIEFVVQPEEALFGEG